MSAATANISSASPRKIRLIKGSHIVTRKLYEGDHAYILQNEDQRIVFVIPYNGDFTLVGTTDKRYEGDPSQVKIDGEEEQYLLKIKPFDTAEGRITGWFEWFAQKAEKTATVTHAACRAAVS